MKITTLALLASLMLMVNSTTKACDIDAARMMIQAAIINADDATGAEDLGAAQAAADDAERAAQSAAVFLSDCNSK
ncbi:hypothetical protein NLN96_18850 [Citrobacter portucalensis]|uniref:hypothetical protein n=1 Tax=Citrobacter portucalensis TaxID=1639133 RepID=UPI00226B1A1D|nr:hypothetical protein [Citrobacter portucalensis]MCX9019057.1 hypothetical protein [Citrobacter portucalensis]